MVVLEGLPFLSHSLVSLKAMVKDFVTGLGLLLE